MTSAYAAGSILGRTALIIAVALTAACGAGEQAPSPVPTVAESRPTTAASEQSVTQEDIGALLDLEDVRGLINFGGEVGTRFLDLRKLAEAADPTRVADIESWHGHNFATPNISSGLTLNIKDLTTEAAARAHFESKLSTTPGMQTMESPIGDASAEAGANAERSGSVVIFLKADLLVELHTSHPENGTPFISLEGLRQLAEIVDGRLP